MAVSERKKQQAARKNANTNAVRQGGFGALVTQHQAVAVDSLFRLLGEPLSSLMTLAVIGIALALPLSLLLLLQNLQGLGAGLEQSRAISVYLDQGMALQSQQALTETIAGREGITAVKLVSAEEALEEFRAASGLGNVLDGLDENPLPAVIEVIPADAGTDTIEAQIEALSAMPGVEMVEYDLQWLQRLDAIVALATSLALMLAGMLGLGVLLVIGNTVRLAIENRRAEIVVVKLVGGTDAYVARPFLYTGLWYGAGGGFLALLLVFAALAMLKGPYENLMGTLANGAALQSLSLSGAFAVMAGAALLGWLGAQISVYRHLRAVEPD
jgi:cell division transport system permease protein